jgi:hypothetical protein
MKGLSRKNFSQVGRRLDDWFSAASHSSLPERLNYGRHASSRSAQLTEIHSTLITWQPIHATLQKLLNADFHSPY